MKKSIHCLIILNLWFDESHRAQGRFSHKFVHQKNIAMTNTDTVSSIMNKPVVTLQAEDNLKRVRDTFDTHPTDYIPILRGGGFLGIIHKSDFKFFMAGLVLHGDDYAVNNFRLQRIQAQEIMTTSEDIVQPDTSIESAIKLFSEHHFKALPVLEGKTLVGVVTPFDILQGQFVGIAM